MRYTKDESNARADEKESCGTTLFSQLGFDEDAHDSRYTSSVYLSFYAGNYWKAHPTNPILLSFTRSPTFTRRHAHLENVATPTRQRRKTFDNWLTGP